MKTFPLMAVLVLLSGFLRAAGQPLAIDKTRSRVEVAVKATVDSFTATLADYDAIILIEVASGHVTSATLDFRFADVKTGKVERDRHMLEWAEAETFPSGRFELAGLEPTPAGGQIAQGRLTFHGVTHALSFPVTITTDRHHFGIEGDVEIDTRMFGLPVIRRFALLKVDPIVRIRFHLQGTLDAR